jgi:CRISPR/Cas system-associated endonuclease Cas1
LQRRIVLFTDGRAALAYFRAWRSFPLHRKGTKRRPIPRDWHQVAARIRPNRTMDRRATHPMNAVLNYGYAVLQSQMQIALAAAGFDPTIGLMHTERPGHPAFVLT